MEEMELICFNMISSVGMAKSSYVEAMRAAAKGSFEEAAEKLKEGDGFYAKGHDSHADLIAQEASGNPVQLSLILMHAEDQMLSAETIRLLAEENMKLYQKLAEIEKE